MKKIIILISSCLVCGSLRSAQQELAYPDLVKRLTDLERLATLPVPGEQCAQWSSYDRASRYDAATDRYMHWGANEDGGGFIRKEGDKLVLAEMEGPGCIWRIWSATADQGHVRIYLDGAIEPAVDLPFIGYFDRKHEPFTRSALVHTVARGLNNYTPIPYQKSCKIVADPEWGNYYHFTYSTFPKGTKVPTFKCQLGAADVAALDQANAALTHCGFGAGQKRSGEELWSKAISAPAGKTATVAELKGPQAITGIRLKLDLPPSPADRAVLRELALQIKWDGEQAPSVWAPLGDFFGTCPGANQYQSLPLGLGEDGWWYCNWYMPFAQQALLELVNDGKAARTVSFEIVHAPLSQPIAQLGRFHAKWHRDAFLPRDPQRSGDWTIVTTEGAGRFVGVMLHVWNPRGGWWGEGDEKFFVDGEKFPSTFGTGSEDYFGYAWCNASVFKNAFHNQTRNDGKNRDHVSVNRWQVADNVPFQKSFDGIIEKCKDNTRTLYAAVAYWYVTPGGKDPYGPMPLSERVGYGRPQDAYHVAGALEGENLKVLGKTGGEADIEDMHPFKEEWSGSAQLRWRGAKAGDKLDLALPVKQAGRYRLGMQFTKAPGGGLVQLYLDGQKIGTPMRLSVNKLPIPTHPLMPMGEYNLSAGDHKLTVEMLGADEKGAKLYLFGLDYVKLDRR